MTSVGRCGASPVRLAKEYEICHIQKPCLIYHEHGEDRISNDDCKRVLGYERLLVKYDDDIDRIPGAFIERTKDIMHSYWKCGKPVKALKIWLRFTCMEPLNVWGNTKSLLSMIISRDSYLYHWYHIKTDR